MAYLVKSTNQYPAALQTADPITVNAAAPGVEYPGHKAADSTEPVNGAASGALDECQRPAPECPRRQFYHYFAPARTR